MARTQKTPDLDPTTTPSRQPVSKETFVRETLEACRNGQCCSSQAMLDAAYEQYVNNPYAPWNKVRRRR